MNKMITIALIVVAVFGLYLILTVTVPILAGITVTVNETMAASSNMSNYPGASEGLLISPWLLYFAPVVIAGAVIIIVLKKG